MPDDALPNQNVCPVCLAHPGALPVPNKAAIEAVIKVGLALGGEVAHVSKFDRKNYFYPDLPKGYQISQYDQPLVQTAGLLGVRVRRIHLEEDTARLVHETSSKSDVLSSNSLVDFNRSGVPLMELVTEPDIKSAEQAVEFAKELQLILRYLGVSDADMEKGHLRIEPNVSLATRGENDEWVLGTKTELKNINSFRAVAEGIAYELKRQEEVLEKGERVTQETRGWDEQNKKTVSQRSKEDAHDYRYFPEPDIPPFVPGELFDLESLKRSLPELPAHRRSRFMKEYELTEVQADILVWNSEMSAFFEAAISELDEEVGTPAVLSAFNYLTSDLRGIMNETGTSFDKLKINPENFADLIALLQEGKIGSRQAKDILQFMFETGEDPREIMTREGLETVQDSLAIETVVKEVITEQPKAVEEYKQGKDATLQFLVGQAMKKLKGAGSPEILKEAFMVFLRKK